jgi:Acetyltransferase (GNAT) domain
LSIPITIVDPRSFPGWDALIEEAPQAFIFHSSAWARVLSESYGYRPIYFAAVDSGRLVGLIPVMEIDSFLTGKRGVALPFTDLCEPVAPDRPTFERLLEEVVSHGKKAGWKAVEFRGGERFLSDQPFTAGHRIHTLALVPDEAIVEKAFKPNTRRNIRKAGDEGITVALERSAKAVAVYYRLHCGTRRHHGLPPQPWSFFGKIHEHVIAPCHGFVALAHYQGRAIAGAVYFHSRGHGVYKFGASDRAHLALRPNNLVMWEAIRWCCRNGIRTFSFGRTEPGNEGLLQFKRGWGAVEQKLNYYRYDLKAGAFNVGASGPRTSYAVFKLMPAPLLRLAGALMYRHVG